MPTHPVTNTAVFHFGVCDLVTLAHDRSPKGPVVWQVVGHQARWGAGSRAITYLLRSTQKEGYYEQPVKVVEVEASEAELVLVQEKPVPVNLDEPADFHAEKPVPDLHLADHADL